MPPIKATRLSMTEYDGVLGAGGSVRQIARDLIHQARTEAENLQRAVREAADRQAKAEQDRTDRALHDARTAAAAQACDRRDSADAAADLLGKAQRMTTAIESMTPWLTDLVTECVTRIIGAVPQPELTACMVRAALDRIDPAQTLTLRVHPLDRPALRSAMDTFPARFAPVAEVVTDLRIDRGSLVLDARCGLYDLSLASQLEALRQCLEQAQIDPVSDAGVLP